MKTDISLLCRLATHWGHYTTYGAVVRYLWCAGNISGMSDPNSASPVISTGLLYHMVHATDSLAEVVFLLDIGKWIATFYLLTMTTNVLSSGEPVKSVRSPVV